MLTPLFRIAVVFIISLAGAAAGAQTSTDPVSSARLRLGPVGLTPSFVIQPLSYESNVFNDPENPREDLIARARPEVAAWLRLGRARLALNGSVEGVYFKRYASESGVNGAGSAALELPMTRLGAIIGAGHVNTRERAGFEIDARARRTEIDLFAGLNARIGGKSGLGIRAERRTTDYEDEVLNSGIVLAQSLNRQEDAIRAFFEHRPTPMMAVRLGADVRRDEFASLPMRNGQRVRVAPDIEFTATEQFTGAASIGYQKFQPSSAEVVPLSGIFASVDLTYVLRGTTKFGIQSMRDIQYSFDTAQNYYEITGIVGSIAQAVGDTWGVSARGGRQLLDYRGTSADTSIALHDTHAIDLYGAGLFWRLTPTIEVSVNGDYQRRRTALAIVPDYDNLRIGSFITYGRGQ